MAFNPVASALLGQRLQAWMLGLFALVDPVGRRDMIAFLQSACCIMPGVCE